MTIAWGGTLSKTHLDADTDDPSQARAELEAIIDRLNNKLVNVTILTASDKTGNDAGIVSGTAGTDGNLVQWNADGDVVDGPDVLSAISSGTSTDVVSKGALQGAGVAALVPVSQASASGDATVDFTGLDSTSDVWIVYGVRVIPASDADSFHIRTSSDGSTFDNGASNYRYTHITAEDAASSLSVHNSTGDSELLNTTGNNQGNAAGEAMDFMAVITNPSDTSRKSKVEWTIKQTTSSGREQSIWGHGVRNIAQRIQGVRFFFGSSNVSDGGFRLYKVKQS